MEGRGTKYVEVVVDMNGGPMLMFLVILFFVRCNYPEDFLLWCKGSGMSV